MPPGFKDLPSAGVLKKAAVAIAQIAGVTTVIGAVGGALIYFGFPLAGRPLVAFTAVVWFLMGHAVLQPSRWLANRLGAEAREQLDISPYKAALLLPAVFWWELAMWCGDTAHLAFAFFSALWLTALVGPAVMSLRLSKHAEVRDRGVMLERATGWVSIYVFLVEVGVSSVLWTLFGPLTMETIPIIVLNFALLSFACVSAVVGGELHSPQRDERAVAKERLMWRIGLVGLVLLPVARAVFVGSLH